MKVIQDCYLSQIPIWSGMKVQILRLSSLNKYLLMLPFQYTQIILHRWISRAMPVISP